MSVAVAVACGWSWVVGIPQDDLCTFAFNYAEWSSKRIVFVLNSDKLKISVLRARNYRICR